MLTSPGHLIKIVADLLYNPPLIEEYSEFSSETTIKILVHPLNTVSSILLIFLPILIFASEVHFSNAPWLICETLSGILLIFVILSHPANAYGPIALIELTSLENSIEVLPPGHNIKSKYVILIEEVSPSIISDT